MYNPEPFRSSEAAATAELVRDYPFANLVTHTLPPQIAHLPLVPCPGEDDCLLGHVARANPVSTCIEEGVLATAVFLGPHAYVSPTWYATPALVPTWNYAAVQASGRLEVVPRAALADLVEGLSDHFERGRDDPWVPDYAEAMLDAIVGFRLYVDQWQTKLKLSQNRAATDRAGVVEALSAGGPEAVATARWMRRFAGTD